MINRRDAICLCALALLTLGVVMVHSAGMGITPVDIAAPADPTPSVTLVAMVTSRTTLFAAAAMVALVICSLVPVRVLDRAAALPRPRSLALLLVGTLAILALLAAVYLPGVGKEVNGAHRWVRLPVIGQFQPSEVAKWCIVPLLACAAVAARERIRSTVFGAGPLLIALAAVSTLIVFEDLGTAVLVAGSGTVLLLAAGMRAWIFAVVAPFAAAAFAVAVLTSPYRVDRVVAFVDPFFDPDDKGYHMVQSMATIAGGGPFGRGLGHGLQKFGYLPEDTTDFVFAVICEELGLAGAALLLTIYAVLFAALAGVVRAATSPVLRLVAFGVLVTLAGQTLINLFVVTGLGPTKGIALPLVSAGGTGWILIGAALGVVIAIDRVSAVSSEAPARDAEPSVAA